MIMLAMITSENGDDSNVITMVLKMRVKNMMVLNNPIQMMKMSMTKVMMMSIVTTILLQYC